MLIVVSGPSGCGKSTIIHRALKDLDRLRFSVSHTTRPLRGPEKNGRDYYFISRPEFEGMIRSSAFLEWAIVHGQYYGTSQAEVEAKSATADLVLDIDVQGARQVKARGLRATMIFVVPPRFADLKERLERRGEDDADTIRRRLQAAVQEVESIPEFDYLIINDDLDRAAEDFKSIVRSGRCRVDPQSEDVQAVLKTFREVRWD